MSEASKIEFAKPFTINCKKCGFLNIFNQPYAYHAGFADQGFLYNDDGDLALVWNVYDADFQRIAGRINPWTLNDPDKVRTFEDWLPVAPHGGRWRFNNPARCVRCKAEIAPPMGKNVYYVLYDESIVADGISKGDFKSLKDVKKKLAS